MPEWNFLGRKAAITPTVVNYSRKKITDDQHPKFTRNGEERDKSAEVLPQYAHFETEEERRVRIRLKNMGLKFNKGKQTHLLAALLVEGGEGLDEEKGVTLCWKVVRTNYKN